MREIIFRRAEMNMDEEMLKIITRRLDFICRRFGTLCSIFIGRYEDGTECSETSAYKIQTPGNYPKESNIQNTAKA